MRLDLYQAETQRLACEQSAMLDEARQKLAAKQFLSPLEQAGILHALQVLIENAIGKAKHLLKAVGDPVPVSAYDAFSSLVRVGVLLPENLPQWNEIISIRNRIVHDYMNIDMKVILALVQTAQHQFIIDFLQRPIQRTDKD